MPAIQSPWIDPEKPIGVASDHAGFRLKEKVRAHLEGLGFRVYDFGTNSEERTDYPDYGSACARAVAKGECTAGIVICGTGIGMSIVANKVKGVRAALCDSVTMARLARQHNNANVLALGARIIGESVALDVVDTWLSTGFEGGRHATRVEKISKLDYSDP